MEVNYFDRVRAVITVFICLFQTSTSTADDEMSSELVAVVGETVELACRTSLDAAVDWLFIRRHSTEQRELGTSGIIHAEYSDRMYLDTEIAGCFNLAIRNVAVEDSGTYSCVEDEGLGERHNIELIVQGDVSESRPTPIIRSTGDTAVLPCHTSSDSAVDWSFVRRDSGQHRELCVGGTILDKYRDRMTLDTTIDGDFNLVIEELTVNDSGIYECTEDDGLGEVHSVELIVQDQTRELNITNFPATAAASIFRIQYSLFIALPILAILMIYKRRRRRR